MGTAHPAAPVACLCLLAGTLTGCASHVKGSWACALESGVVCGSIIDIDRGGAPKTARATTSADPVIDGAIPARLWGQGGWTVGSIAGAPIREPDPILKVALAPWIDGEGDYHAGGEIYAVMRHGGWFVAPRDAPRHVDLARLAKPDPAPDSAKSAAAGVTATASAGVAAVTANPPPSAASKSDKK